MILWSLAFIITPLVIIKIKRTYEDYKMLLAGEFVTLERDYNELLAQEGIVYDKQLKYNERLSEIASLYEITKDMSKGLHFADIFNILAEYLQKTFLFKKAYLILLNIVYETKGLQDSILKVKGIIPKLEVSTRPLGGHDKKICNFLKSDIKKLQIVKSKMPEDPYLEFLPEGAQSFVAVPIVIDSQLTGVLAVEDLSTSDFEKFSILAAQFALEMRRTILYEKVEEMAITDGLTKAFAKRHIMERLGEEFERSMRHNLNLSFLMIDIDYFKNYNDRYGHLVGDVVLKDIVTLLKANTREVDLVGRFGGEEFCVILPETGKDEARLVAERIREMIDGFQFKAYDELTDVTVSIGIATYPDQAKDMSEFIENSDSALYAAKHAGRNRVCMYEG